VAFDSLPPAALTGNQGAAGAESIGAVLQHMQRRRPGHAHPTGDCRAKRSAGVSTPGDELVDADVKQLVEDLHDEVGRLVRAAYGVSRTTRPR
jgi:hypothetical protein